MKEIDWSKAPEGATHAGRARNGLICWYKIFETGDYFFYYEDPGCDFEGWDSGDGSGPCHLPLIPRPCTAWNGQGLPPVGTVCEIQQEFWSDANWQKVTIKYASTEYFITEDGAGEQHWHARSVQFRPIRTPEQVAAYEREAAVQVIADIISPGDCVGSLDVERAYRVYDAGYRKP
jgi:hypothetical protein